LKGDGVFGSEEHGGAVVRGGESHAVFGDVGKLEERDHLEAMSNM
jgi:hypothetical protein